MIARYALKMLQGWREARTAPPAGDGSDGGVILGSGAVPASPARPVTDMAAPAEESAGHDPLDTVINAHELVKRYGSLTAVDTLSFSVQTGEIFGLLGPNGAGKTTTLEMLEGLRTPDSGDAVVLGQSVRRHARRIKERIGVQLQATALPPKITVAEAIDLFGAFYAHRRPTPELLVQFDLADKADALAESLSGGQVQRLSIALALVNDPDLVFLDEPTTGLDPQARLNLWAVIDGMRARGKTVVLTTHYMEEAERLCDHLAIVDRGHIVALGTPEQLITTYAPGASIEFDTPAAQDDALRSIPGVDEAEVDGGRVLFHTTAPESVLSRLFDPDAAWAPSVRAMRDLRVRQGTLEDVFIALTGRRLRS